VVGGWELRFPFATAQDRVRDTRGRRRGAGRRVRRHGYRRSRTILNSQTRGRRSSSTARA